MPPYKNIYTYTYVDFRVGYSHRDVIFQEAFLYLGWIDKKYSDFQERPEKRPEDLTSNICLRVRVRLVYSQFYSQTVFIHFQKVNYLVHVEGFSHYLNNSNGVCQKAENDNDLMIDDVSVQKGRARGGSKT